MDNNYLVCVEHKHKTAKKFCTQCEKFICNACAVDSHHSHINLVKSLDYLLKEETNVLDQFRIKSNSSIQSNGIKCANFVFHEAKVICKSCKLFFCEKCSGGHEHKECFILIQNYFAFVKEKIEFFINVIMNQGIVIEKNNYEIENLQEKIKINFDEEVICKLFRLRDDIVNTLQIRRNISDGIAREIINFFNKKQNLMSTLETKNKFAQIADIYDKIKFERDFMKLYKQFVQFENLIDSVISDEERVTIKNMYDNYLNFNEMMKMSNEKLFGKYELEVSDRVKECCLKFDNIIKSNDADFKNETIRILKIKEDTYELLKIKKQKEKKFNCENESIYNEVTKKIDSIYICNDQVLNKENTSAIIKKEIYLHKNEFNSKSILVNKNIQFSLHGIPTNTTIELKNYVNKTLSTKLTIDNNACSTCNTCNTHVKKLEFKPIENLQEVVPINIPVSSDLIKQITENNKIVEGEQLFDVNTQTGEQIKFIPLDKETIEKLKRNTLFLANENENENEKEFQNEENLIKRNTLTLAPDYPEKGGHFFDRESLVTINNLVDQLNVGFNNNNNNENNNNNNTRNTFSKRPSEKNIEEDSFLRGSSFTRENRISIDSQLLNLKSKNSILINKEIIETEINLLNENINSKGNRNSIPEVANLEVIVCTPEIELALPQSFEDSLMSKIKKKDLSLLSWEERNLIELVSIGYNCHSTFIYNPISNVTNEVEFSKFKFPSFHSYINILPWVYISGGKDSSNKELNNFSKFRRSGEKDFEFVLLAPMQDKRSYHMMIHHSSSIYAISGSRIKSCEKFSIEENSWSLLPALNISREKSSACIQNDEHLYVFLGFDRTINKYVSNFERLNIKNESKAWEIINVKGSQNLLKKQALCCFNYSKGVYLIGGINALRNESKEILNYDFKTNTITMHKGSLNVNMSFNQVELKTLFGFEDVVFNFSENFEIVKFDTTKLIFI